MAVRKGSMASAQCSESQQQSKYEFTYSKTVGASYIAVLTGTEIEAEATVLDGSSVDPPAACSHCKLRAGVAQTVCCKLSIKIRLRHCDRYFCIIRLIWCLILQPRYAQHLTTSGTAGGGYKLSHSDEVKSIYDSSMPRCAQHVSHAPDYVLRRDVHNTYHTHQVMCYIRTGICATFVPV